MDEDPIAAVDAGRGAGDDRPGIPRRSVDDVVIGGKEVAEDPYDAGFGLRVSPTSTAVRAAEALMGGPSGVGASERISLFENVTTPVDRVR
jgi:hypothetical protein